MRVQEAKSANATEVDNELSQHELDIASAGKFNRFVTFGDIKGESTEKDHKDW